ncbi:MAG: MarR family transcriptional regulator [Rhodothermales bacterium]|nr:MarR family transcriptional regulator [Rhodothermales bacterium]
MATRLQREIKQTKPFASPGEEALLNVMRTAAVLEHTLAEALKPYGVTPTQYNALRILRGAGAEGLCRNEIRDRMIKSVPDATRLLDRLEQAGLAKRRRSDADRRYVTACITNKGLDLLDQIDGPLNEMFEAMLGHLSRSDLRTLSELLGRARERC